MQTPLLLHPTTVMRRDEFMTMVSSESVMRKTKRCAQNRVENLESNVLLFLVNHVT
jgi:hypothetical protein